MSLIRRLYVPVRAREDVIPHLGATHHWKEGRSAKCLVDQWWAANDFPATIRDLLDQAADWRGAELVDAFVERCTSLADGRPTHSQSDLLAIAGLKDGLAILGIEAKVDEGFDRTVAEWQARASPGKAARLTKLCGLLGLDPLAVSALRYQLFHRTAATILEAKRYRARRAAMIVQSWSAHHHGFADYAAFFKLLGLTDLAPNQLSDPLLIDGIEFRTGWSAERESA